MDIRCLCRYGLSWIYGYDLRPTCFQSLIRSCHPCIGMIQIVTPYQNRLCMHQIRKADVISINRSPCHCRRLKTGTGFRTVIRRPVSIGKPQKCRSVPFRISRIKCCRLRTIFFFDPEKILCNHPIRFIPGYAFKFPASFFSDPFHRIQNPVFVINILPGSSSFRT